MKNLHESIDVIDKDIIELLLRVDRSLEIVKDLISAEEFDKRLYGECKIIEEEADELEVSIDEKIISAIARFQPAAGDLRYLVKVQEITTDLERITDLCVGISKLIRSIHKKGYGEKKNLTHLDMISEKVIYVFRLFKTAFLEKKVDNTYMILGLDDEIDALRNESISGAMEAMQKDPDLILVGINNIIIAQKFERIADIVENLAESYIYISKGEDIRHKNIN